MEGREKVLLLIVLLGSVASSLAVPASVHLSDEADGAVVTLRWTRPVDISTHASGCELLIRFSRPLEIGNLTEHQVDRSVWIESLRTGYDSLLIRVSREGEFTVEQSGDGLEIHYRADLGRSTGNGNQVRLDLLRARLYLETFRYEAADRLLRELRQRHRDRAEVIGALANLERFLERRVRAVKYYAEALRLVPDNEDYRHAYEVLNSHWRPRVAFEGEHKSVTDAQTEWIARLGGQVPLFGYFSGGLTFETNRVEIDAVRLRDGKMESFSGLRRRGEFFLSHETDSGKSLKASLLSDGSMLGGALQLQRPDYRGRFELTLDYRRPNWDFIEGVVNGITRDRAQLRRFHRLTSSWTLNGSLAGNRYLTKDRSRAASSVGVEAGLSYQFAEKPIFVEYGIEAEYRTAVSERTGPTGGVYSPVPLISREVHFADVAFYKRWSRNCWSEGFGGFSIDRMGGSGPFAGAHLKLEPLRGLGAHLWIDQRLNTVDTSQWVLRAGGSLYWRF
jgi:hypothetical protein